MLYEKDGKKYALADYLYLIQSENERLNQTIQSLTGALDEVTATARHHESENERLKAKMDAIRDAVLSCTRSLDWTDRPWHNIANLIIEAYNAPPEGSNK